MTALTIPTRGRGRQSAAADAKYNLEYIKFAKQLIAFADSVDFKISARGWCYHLEGYNLIDKSQFDKVETLINTMRKDGTLPVDFTASDASRASDGIIHLDYADTDKELEYHRNSIVDFIENSYHHLIMSDYTGVSIELLVEKKDLIGLFNGVCREYQIPIANAKGWNDINSRVNIMKRFNKARAKGKRCILLYCGDFDPAGLNISDNLSKNFKDLEAATGIDPYFIEVQRFGLNYDYIINNDLVWTDNLTTGGKGSNNDLCSQRHKHHKYPYVQDYISKYGCRKVEANALLKNIPQARELLLNTVMSLIDASQAERYRKDLKNKRDELMEEFNKRWSA